jgi:hypothetical protein
MHEPLAGELLGSQSLMNRSSEFRTLDNWTPCVDDDQLVVYFLWRIKVCLLASGTHLGYLARLINS